MVDLSSNERIIEVAIDLFGQRGLDAVTTRLIAEQSGVQQSAISYYFGSKDQLYLACAERIAGYVRRRVAPLRSEFAQAASASEARARVETILSGLLAMMLDEAMAPIARFVVREQMAPTPAFTVLWDGAMRHIAEPLMRHLRAASGERLSSDAAHLRCFTLLGQVFAFRFGQASLLSLTGWTGVGPHEAALAREAVLANARAIMAGRDEGVPR